MKRTLAIGFLVLGGALAPLSYADTSSRVAAAKETVREKVDDATITSKVKAALARDKAMSAVRINVSTESGVVKLTGQAKTPAEVDKAVAIAQSTPGVSTVHNEVQIGPSSEKQSADVKRATRDAWITSKVKAKFAQDADVSARKIRVKTFNGVVRLTGTVDTMDEANKAVQLAQGTKGVKSVTNNIQVAATGATR